MNNTKRKDFIINQRDNKARLHQDDLIFEVFLHGTKSLQRLKRFDNYRDAHNYCLVYNTGAGYKR